MKIVQEVLSLTLGLSALIGFQILISDNWLWSAAPSHAYGLIGFVMIDIALAAIVLRSRAAAGGASVTSIIQFGAMMADITVGQPTGVPSSAFRSYLLNDMSYILLLGVQIAILAVSLAVFTVTLLHRHARPGLGFAEDATLRRTTV